MRLHHPFSDGDSRRNQSTKGLSRVVIGSAVGGFLGAAAFFAVDGLMPSTTEAYGVPGAPGHIQDSVPGAPGYVQDKGVVGF